MSVRRISVLLRRDDREATDLPLAHDQDDAWRMRVSNRLGVQLSATVLHFARHGPVCERRRSVRCAFQRERLSGSDRRDAHRQQRTQGSFDRPLKRLASHFCDTHTAFKWVRAIRSRHVGPQTTACRAARRLPCAARNSAFRRNERGRLPYEPNNWRLPLSRLEKSGSWKYDVLPRDQW